MATRHHHAALQGSMGQQGGAQQLLVPGNHQDIARGRSRGAGAAAALRTSTTRSNLFVLPSRPHVKVRGMAAHASSSHAQQKSCRVFSYRVLHRGQSLVYSKAARRSSISSAHDSGSTASRGLTVHQAARFLQLQRLQAARLQLQASDESSDDYDDSTPGPEVPVDSHPISVPTSGRPSSNGSRYSPSGRAVQGVPELPPRSGAGSRASSRPGSPHGRHSSEVQANFRLMQELLRQDYAVGYIMLGWLLRCTWAITPAIALLLQLPQPAVARITRQQLPSLLAWLLFGRGSSAANSRAKHQQVAQQLSPEALRELQEQLVGPTAAVASCAGFAKAYQMLTTAPVTAQQLVAFMRKEEELLSKFPGLDLTSNLQQGSSAAAVTALLGDTHTNASAAAAAAAVMGDALSRAAAASSAQGAAGPTAAFNQAAPEEAVSALASAVIEDASSSADPALAGLSSLVAQLADQAGVALQHALADQAAATGAGPAQQELQQPQGVGLSPEALRVQLQALQRRLPGRHDLAALLADYQAWLDQLRGHLLEQHEQTEVHLHNWQQQLGDASSAPQQLETDSAYTQQQQELMQAAKQKALQRYAQAKEAVLAVQQQLSAIASMAPAHHQQPEQQAATGSITAVPALQDPATQQSSTSQPAATPAGQVAAGQLAAAVSSLNEAIEGAAAGADRTSGELSTLVTVLTGQLQCLEERGPALANTSFVPGLLDATEVARLSAAAVGDVWDAEGGSSRRGSAAAAVWAPMDAVEVARLSAAAVGDAWYAGNASSNPAAAPVQGAEVKQEQSAAAVVVQQLQRAEQPVQGAPTQQPLPATTAAAALELQQVEQQLQPQAQAPSPLSPLQKLLLIDAAIVEPQWRKFVAQASSLPGSGVQALKQAAGGARAAAAQLQGAAAGASQQLAGSAAALTQQVQGAAGAAAAGLQAVLATPATQVQGAVAQGARQVMGQVGARTTAVQDQAAAAAAQLQQQAAGAASQLQKQAANAAAQLLHSDAAAAAATLQAEAAASVAQLQQRAMAAAAEAAAAIEEAKGRVDGKGPGEQRSWQEEVLACSGILSLISPYWWSEETIAGTRPIPQAGSSSADSEPLVQGAYGSDGSGMDDGGTGGAGGGSGEGQGPNGSSSNNNSGGDESPGGEDGSGGSDGSSGGGGGGKQGGGGQGGGSGGSGPGGNSGGPWDGFEQFPPAGGFDPVMLVPIALAAATAGLAGLFGSRESSTQARRRGRASSSSVQREAVRQLKSSGGTDKGAGDQGRGGCSHGAGQQQPQQPQQQHGLGTSGPRTAGTAGARTTAADVRAAAAAGVTLWGPPAAATPHMEHADLADWAPASHAPHLHLPAQDQPVLAWAGAEAAGAAGPTSMLHHTVGAASAAGMAAVAGSSPSGVSAAAASPRKRAAGGSSSSSIARPAGAAVVPFSTSQQISWEELEELPLAAKQEILSLRAVVAANHQQQRVLGKQLQQVEKQLAAKEQELAASVADVTVLRAEHAAALSQLQGAAAAAGGEVAQTAADCSKSGGISTDQLRSTYAAQIAHLTKEAAAASSAAAAHIAALSAQLDAHQASAADAVASLEMRLAKVTASKARVQLQLEGDVAARDAELLDSKQQAALLRHSLQEALAALQEAQQQVLAEEGKHAQLQEALAAANAAKEQQAGELQAAKSRLEQLTAEVSAGTADLAAAEARAAGLEQQLQQSLSSHAAQQLSAAADSEAAAARIYELSAELSGLRAGYGPVLLGLESELAVERTNAHQLVAGLKQRLADTKAGISSQMQHMAERLRDAEAACAAACARSDSLQQELQAMQQQHQAQAAQLEFAKAASAAEVAQLQGSVRAVQERLQAAADCRESTRAHAEDLLASLEASLAQSRERVAGLEQQISDLKQQQLASAAAGEQLEALCADSKCQLEEAQARLESERAAAQEQLAALSAELEGVRTGYTTFVGQLEMELAAERSFGRRQVAEVRQQLDQAQASLGQLQQQLHDLEVQKAALEADHAALQQASSAQQQAAAEELSSLRQQVQVVRQQEAGALERCSYLEAELAAAAVEEAEEVAALGQALEKQRAEMAAQVAELQARLQQQEQEALAQMTLLQQRMQEQVQLHERAQQQHEQESSSSLQAAQDSFDSRRAQLEAELQQTTTSQQQKLAELSDMLTAARNERQQLLAAMQSLGKAVSCYGESSAAAGSAAMATSAAVDAALQPSVPLADAVQRLQGALAGLTAASEASAGALQQQLQDAEQRQQQLQQQCFLAETELATVQQQYSSVRALADSLSEQLAAVQAAAAQQGTDKEETISQLRHQLSVQEAKLQDLTLQVSAAQQALSAAERRRSDSTTLTEARVAALSGAVRSTGSGEAALDEQLGLRHASQGTAGSVSTVSTTVAPQPTPGTNLMPLLELSSSSITAGAAPAAAASDTGPQLAEVSAQLAASRQEVVAKAQEVGDLSSSLQEARGRLNALETQLQHLQGQHSTETAALREAVAAATSQVSDLQSQLEAALARAQQLQQELQEAERRHAEVTASLQQLLQASTAAAAEKVAALEASAAEVAAARDAATAAATKAAADLVAVQSELAAAQAAHAAAQQQHSSDVAQLQQQNAGSAAAIAVLQQQLQEAVAAAEAAQVALADSTTQACQLTEALACAREDMCRQVEDIGRQHAAVAAESAARLQGLQQQVESQQGSAAAARAERDQAQQEALQLQAQLSEAAAQQQEREAALRQQLADAQEGLQYNIAQMEAAAEALTAAGARQQQVVEEKAVLEAERAQLLQRCQNAEQQLQLFEQQQSEQLKSLFLALQTPSLPAGEDPLPGCAPAPLLAVTSSSRGIAAAAVAADAAPALSDSRRSSATEASSVKSDLLGRSGELTQLAANISSLVACCNQRQKQLDDMAAELAASAATSTMWRAQAESGAEQAARAVAEHQQAQQLLQQKAAEADGLASQLRSLQQQLEAAAGEKGAAAQQLAAAQEQLAQLSQQAAGERKDSQQQLEELQKQLATHQAANDALQQQQQARALEVQALQEQLGAKAAKLSQLQQQAEVYAAQEQSLKQQLLEQLEAAADSQQALQASLLGSQQQAAAATAEKAELQSQLQALQQQLAGATAAKDELAAKCAALQAHCSRLTADQAEQEELQDQVQQLEQELQDSQQQLQQLRQDLDTKAAAEQELAQQVQQLQEQAQSGEASLQQLQRQLEEESQAHSSTKEQHAAAQLELHAAQEQLHASQAQLAAFKQELQQRLAQKASSLTAAVAECESLQACCQAADAASQQGQAVLAAAVKAHALDAAASEAAAAAVVVAAELQHLKQSHAALHQQLVISSAELQAEQEVHAVAAAAVKELEGSLAVAEAASTAGAQLLAGTQQQLATLQEQHAAVQRQLAEREAAAQAMAEAQQQLEQRLQAEQEAHALAATAIKELEEQVAGLAAASSAASNVLATTQQQLEALQEQHAAVQRQLAEQEAAVAAGTKARQLLEQHLSELQDAADAATTQEGEQRQLDLQQKQAQVDALLSELDEQRNMAADLGLHKQRLEQQLSAARDSLQQVEAQLQAANRSLEDTKQELAAAHENQQELTEQLLEAHAQKAQMVLKRGVSSRGGGSRATDESGAWRLRTAEDAASGPDELQDALLSTQQQLESLEQDVLALEFVAEHHTLEDICDLDMHYSNPHLESIHRTVVQLRKQATGLTSRLYGSMPGSEVSTEYTASASTVGSSRAVSKGGAPGAAPDPPHAVAALAQLGAKTEAAASRPLVVSSAVDSSLQAVQAAKESLQSMHDKDITLELFSQSVQDVLARKEAGSTRVSESPLRHMTDAGHQPADGPASNRTTAGGRAAEPDTSLRVQSLLAAKTKQEVEAIVAEAFDTADGPQLDAPLEALLSRSTSRTQAAAASAGGASAGGASSLFSVGGASALSTGSGSAATEKLSAEIECYKRQLAELQQELDAKAEAAAAASKLSTGAQETMLQLQAQLETAQAETAAAQAAQQELEQQKVAAEEARQQLVLQVSVLQQEAAGLELLNQQLQEAQAANMEGLQAEKGALEAELTQLQQQLQQLLAHKGAMQDAATEMLMSPGRQGSKLTSTAGSTAAVSAVRAATHKLLLHSNPFELHLDLSSEQMMLPTSNDDAPHERPGSTLGGDAGALLSRPLHANLLTPNSALHSKEMDGMAEMLSSNQQDCINSQPASAEMETEYMHYTRPAHMTLTMLDGANRQPALPTSEAEGGTSAANTPADTPRGRQQHQLASPRPPASPAAASCTIIEEHPEGDADRAGVIADSAPSVGIGALVSSLSKRSLGASRGSRGRGLALSAPGVQYDLEADEAQRLAQRALRTLQSQKASLKERGSWPGDDRASSAALALASAAQDISRLGVELQEQQTAVRQKLLASQALADSLKRQAAAANLSMDEVVGHFFQVYNIACFVAADRERVLDQLIEARAAEQNFSSQLATKAGQVQQLACDRDLALQKLCHSEEKLVALEAQLISMEAALQQKQEGITAQVAALDVAALAAGPLAGLSSQQLSSLHAMLEQANSIVQQQRSKVQDALLRWRRSSGGTSSATMPASPDESSATEAGADAGADADADAASDAAVAAAISANSKLQLAQLQHEQQQLLKDLRKSLSPRHPAQPGTGASAQGDPAAHAEGQAGGGSGAGGEGQAVVVVTPEYVRSLTERLVALHSLTQHIAAEVMTKHEEVSALQESFTKVEVTKQLLGQQLQAKCAEAAALQEQIQVLHAELAAKQWHAGSASANTSSSSTPTGVAPAAAAQQAAVHKKPSFAARLKMSWGKHPIAPAGASAQTSPGGEAPADAVTGSSSTAAAVGDRLVLAASDAGGGVAGSDVAPSLPAYPSTGSAAGSLLQLYPSSGQLTLPSEASLFKLDPLPSLTGSDDRLATVTRAQPAVQELVQHYEAVADMERTSSCTNSICSLQSEPAAPARSEQAAGRLRPTPLPRVATMGRTASGASSPKSPAAASKIPASPQAGGPPSPGGGSSRSAFGRTIPASGSFTSRIPGSGSLTSIRSPTALSTAGSGASTPNKPSAGGSGADMAAVSRRLHAGDKAPTSAAAAGRTGGLTRTGSASSSKSESASAGGAEAASLRRQVSRLIPGSSNGSSVSERSAAGSSGGGSVQGSIFKAKTAGPAGHSRAGGSADSKKAGPEPGSTKKGSR